MAILFTINGVDKTKQVQINSLKLENILTNKRDMAQFNMVNHSGDGYVPNLGQEVIVYDGATKVFGGIITAIDAVPGSFQVVTQQIKCQDYTRLFDHRLVPNTFTNQTINQIISFLKDNYFPDGFTINNVDANVTVEFIGFNYKPLAVCIQDLANLLNYDWYIDYDKDLHFFAKETVPAPFSLTDTNGNHRYDSLIIRKDNSQIRNTIIVRGGDYLASQVTTNILTNGTDAIYPLGYKYSDFAAHLTGEILSIGIDGVDNADSVDALFNFQEKIIKFKEADKPSANKTLKVSGKPNLPVILRYRSSPDINAMVSAESNGTFTSDGVYEYLIMDKTIKSKEGALQRARAEVIAYAQTLSEGEFVTEVSGLRTGMSIDIQSTSRNINETYIINKVTTIQFSPSTFLYSISLITTRTMDLIDLLQKLILKNTENIDINQSDVTDVIVNVDDTANFVDTLGTFSTHGGTYRWGVDGQQGTWGFATWS